MFASSTQQTTMTSIYHYFVLFTYGMYHLSLFGTLAAPITNIMASVCGSNGTTYMFFTNEQDIKEKNKLVSVGQSAFKLSPLGCCLLQHRDATGCASQNMPICAIDIATNVTRVFNNTCIMEETACKQNIDWRFVQNGLCNEVGLDPVPCTKVYKPVCAIFAGVQSTFSNECLVNAENLRTGADWRIYSENICTEDLIHQIPRVTRSIVKNPTTKNYTSSHLDLEDELEEDITYIQTVPQFETEFISNASPSMLQSMLAKDSSLTNIVSLGTQEFDTHDTQDYTQYAEETIQFPPEPLDMSGDLINSVEATAFLEEENPPLGLWQPTDMLANPEYPAGVSFQSLSTPNITSIPMTHNISSDYTHFTNGYTNNVTTSGKSNNTQNEVSCAHGTTPLCGILKPGTTFTFENICEMWLKNEAENSTWTILHRGKCGECDFSCREEKYKPVCVLRKGISYTLANICYMEKNICLKGSKEYTLLHEGECIRKPELKSKNNNVSNDENTTTISITTNSEFADETTLATITEQHRINKKMINRKKNNKSKKQSRENHWKKHPKN